MLALCFSVAVSPFTLLRKVTAEEQLTLYAKSAVLIDAESGRILYGKNEDEIMPMASTTKIMTLILTLELADLEAMVTVSDYAASMPNVQLHIKAGEQYRLGDLVYSMMLESHNDSAVAIAEHVGGSVEGFAKLMNDKAKQIGCVDTYFITPNGLDAFDARSGQAHSTTAAELAKIMRYCIETSPKKEEFLNITSTRNYSFDRFGCHNKNAFLDMMEGVLTGKTGFTGDAGYCYVCALEQDGRRYIVTLLACGWPNNKKYKWSDTKKLMEYGLENYRKYELRELDGRKESIADVRVEYEYIGRNSEYQMEKPGIQSLEKPEYDSVLIKEDEKIRVVIQQICEIQAPIKRGEHAGSIQYYIDDMCIGTRNLFFQNEIEMIDFIWWLKHVSKRYLVTYVN